MQELATLASIVAALSVGVISPGPSFVMVVLLIVRAATSLSVLQVLG
ncbi:hypothetical protein IVB30_05245 [Bradyrhizobium sp. 200]|nr:hypothetical protein [Bradyrhizobium sp. 200]UPJ50809.1 hypothetical protein IVB30_05245 [Bradyrhizobium sp. 200]